MPIAYQCFSPSHSDDLSFLELRRVQTRRTAPPTQLLDLSSGRSSDWLSPPRVTSLPTSKLGHSLRSYKPSPSLGNSFPSLLSPNSRSSDPAKTATGKLATFGSQRFPHCVTGATKQSGYQSHHLYPVSNIRYGEDFSSGHQSNHVVPPLPTFTTTTTTTTTTTSTTSTTTTLKGSGEMLPRNRFGKKSTDCPSHCSPISEPTSNSRRWTRGPLNCSDLSVAVPLPASPVASETSSRRSSCYINKSVQSLLRRNKTKQAQLVAYPSLPSLNDNFKAAKEPRAHKSNSSHSLNNSTISSSSSYVLSAGNSTCLSFSQSIDSQSLQRSSISDGSLKSSRSFYSSVDSDASYSPLATPTLSHVPSNLSRSHSPASSGQTAIFTGVMSVTDKMVLGGDHADAISISASSERLPPSIEVTEDSDSDESALEDIMANLQSIAASRSSKAQQWELDSHFSLDLDNQTGLNLSADHHYSVDQSDCASVYSFDTTADDEDDPDYFPLPSWPQLGSTSQSPLNKKSSNPSANSTAITHAQHPLRNSPSLEFMAY